MKSILSKILISVILVSVFLLPISPNLELKNKYLGKETTVITINEARAQTPDKNPPLSLNCGISSWFGLGEGSIYGCVATLFWIVFEVVAWVTSFAGGFLDFFVYYSTNSSSYQNNFIQMGWAAVRDVANIFFIIALLYVSIKIILSLDEGHSKKLIGTIVIVALLINFSLFFTRVIVDSSNILAKVFYNNIDQKYQNLKPALGADGEKSVSVGLMRLFNPERILDQNTYNASGGTTMFIIITIMLIAMLCYTAYIFFSVALLFVSRVVMLWFSMVFAPIAFASYTLPFDIPGLGHKEWWKNLFENAFLAPIFTFMLYLIVMFAGFLSEVAKYPTGSTIMQKIMAVMIPFVILMTLLMKAKDMAVKYAGEMGAAVVKGAAVVGGLVLGGAALGAAAVGRGTIGAFMKASATGDSTAQRYLSGTSRNKWDKLKGWTSQKLGQGITFGQSDMVGLQKAAGKKINKSQEKIEHAQHARHELDKESESRYHGKKFKDLSGTEREDVLLRISRNDAAQKKYGKVYKDILENEKNDIDTSVLPSLPITKGQEYLKQSRARQGIGTSLAQSMRIGSYDFRNMSKVVAEENDKTLNKFASGMVSMLGNTIRGSIKTSFGTEYGTGQSHFFKDLGHTISEAMKGAKINVDLSHVGKEAKEGEKGGHH